LGTQTRYLGDARTSESIFGHFRANFFPTHFWTILPLYSLLTTEAKRQQGPSAPPRLVRKSEGSQLMSSKSSFWSPENIFLSKEMSRTEETRERGHFRAILDHVKAKNGQKIENFILTPVAPETHLHVVYTQLGTQTRPLIMKQTSESIFDHFWATFDQLFSDPFFASILPIYATNTVSGRKIAKLKSRGVVREKFRKNFFFNFCVVG